MTGTLYLVPNLLGVCAPADVLPARTIAVAQRLSHFVVETPKVARAFLKTLSPERVISEIEMIVCEPDAEAQAQCTAWLLAGMDVGVISDAGCPGMADPGAAFAGVAHRIGATVVPLVGPSSVLLGLMASGFDGQHFAFHGYLPSKPVDRDATLKQLERSVLSARSTQVFIETPYRNAPLLQAITQNVNGNIALCVAQNLASENELIVSKPLSTWTAADQARFATKAPTLFLLGVTQTTRS